MADYHYLLCDALTGVLLEELPLDCQSFSQAISGVGTLTATLAIGDLPSVVDWRAATTLKRTLLVVQRDGLYPWAGLIMKRRPTSGGTAAELTAETLEGYLGRRRIKQDLTQTAQDVFDIVRAIMTQLQGVSGGNVRLVVSSGSAGYIQTITYLAKDRTKALDAINRLAEVAPGFEYTISWSRSGSVFTPTLTLATPGLASGLGPIVCEYPGNVIDYGYDEDGGDAPNAVTGVGADAGGTPLLSEQIDTTGELAAGYPIFEDEVQMKEESDVPRLAARTTSALAAKLVDHVVPTLQLAPPTQPGDLAFTDIPLGVALRLRATSLYHPAKVNGAPGLDVIRRVTGWSVVPGAAEKVTLTCATTTGRILPPAVQRNTASARLVDQDRRLRALETS